MDDVNKGDVNIFNTPFKLDLEEQSCVCMYTNADGLLNKRDELSVYIETLLPKIIAITEIKPKSKTPFNKEEYNIRNYSLFVNNIPERGVALYVHDSLQAEEHCLLNNQNFKESVWCTFLDKQMGKILLGCIYKSPNTKEENEKELIKLIKHEELQRFDRVLIMGDFNYPNIKWDGTRVVHNDEIFMEALQDAYLTQLIKKPTRSREGQRENILDLIITNESYFVSNINYAGHLGNSDHIILTFNLNLSTIVENKKIYNFDLSKGQYHMMRLAFCQENWIYLQSLDVEEGWNSLKDKIHIAMNKFIPKVIKKSYASNRPMWMTNEVRNSVKRKYIAYKKYLYNNSQCNYFKYIKLRNVCKKKVKLAKKSYEKKIAKELKRNPQKFWKYVQIKTKTCSGISTLKTSDGTVASTEEDKAMLLNNFFASVYTNEDVDNIPKLLPGSKSNNTFLSDIQITPEAVCNKLKLLNPCKAQGPDSIPPRVLKELCNELAVPLAYVFNKTLDSGKLPEGWKKATVTAIFIKG